MTTTFYKIQQFLGKYSTGRNVILLFLITQIIYFIMVLYTIPNVVSYADGMKVLDMQPTGYSAEYANTLLNRLGSEGRDYYLYKQIPMDMIYPFLFAITYSLLLIYLFKKSFNIESKMHYLTIVPLFGGFFDYLENIGIIVMLLDYPDFSTLLANVTNVFSILKSVSTTLFFILLFVGAVGLIMKKIRKSEEPI